jgi:hypothetical protein
MKPLGRKPLIFPNKGWDFRLILSDHKGKVVYEDFHFSERAPIISQLLAKELKEKR